MNSNLFIIIQARVFSTRLPKKILLPFGEGTVLEYMLKRLKKFHDNIIIATVDDGTQEPIVDICNQNAIRYFEGRPDDLLHRYYHAAKFFLAKEDDTIVRLTSDCPFIDSSVLEQMIQYYHDHSFDYVSNTIERTFPRGLDVEIFSFDALKKAYAFADKDFEREHVTPYIHQNIKEKFSIGSFKDSENYSEFRLTLDEQIDYEVLKSLHTLLKGRSDFSYEELKKILQVNRDVFEKNMSVEQKKM